MLACSMIIINFYPCLTISIRGIEPDSQSIKEIEDTLAGGKLALLRPFHEFDVEHP